MFTVIYCPLCNWRSEEMTAEDLLDLGVPWYCGKCYDQLAPHFIKYTEDERDEALRQLNKLL